MPFASILMHWLVWDRACCYFTCNESAQNYAIRQEKHAVVPIGDENELLQEECQ